jgi:dynein heavy chain
MQYIKISEHIVEYSSMFRLYFTSRLRNPHYLPHVQIKVKIVNFVMQQTGLQEQLLSLCIRNEKPDLEFMRTQLIIQSAMNKKQLKEIEDKILEVISKSRNSENDGDLLSDETAVEILTTSKTLALEIVEKEHTASQTELEINETRNLYKQVALHSTCVFFSVESLAKIDHMYQFSLKWFLENFENVIFFYASLLP